MQAIGSKKMIHEFLTDGAQRILERAGRLACERGDDAVEPVHILWALRSDTDYRPGQLLADHGLDLDQIIASTKSPGSAPDRVAGFESAKPQDRVIESPAPAGLEMSPAAQRTIHEAQRHGRALDRRQLAGTEHLLLGLVDTDPELAALLAAHGLDREQLRAGLQVPGDSLTTPVPVDFESLDIVDPTDLSALRRILDASINRAREGLRVIEDYARFGLDDGLLTTRLKDLRHRLTRAIEPLSIDTLAEARETTRDVGTTIRTATEYRRADLGGVVLANLKRTQEALRTIEEFGKIEAPSLARDVEQLRYELYTVERMMVLVRRARDRLTEVRLCALISESACSHPWDWTIREALAGGAQAIQLREKMLPDRELIQRAHRVRELTQRAGALFIVNDRPDVARLTAADGVHVGQEDFTVKDARKIAGPGTIVGVSTHSLEQAAAAVRDGADYLGIGPVFASTTKAFSHLAGLDFVAQANRQISLPMFAIGGISPENLQNVLDHGAVRVAISSAVCSADDPRSVCTGIRRKLHEKVRVPKGCDASTHREPNQEQGSP